MGRAFDTFGIEAIMATNSITLPERCASAFAYLFLFVGGCVLLILNRRNPYIRYHAAQATVFGVVYFAVNLVLGSVPVIGLLLSLLLLMLWVALVVVGFVGGKFRIPLVSGVAEKLLAGLDEPRATFFHRLLAYQVDSVCTILAGAITSLLVILVVSFLPMTQEQRVDNAFIAFVVGLVLFWVYNLVYMVKSGVSVGKKFMNLQVVGINTQQVSAGKMVVRETIGKVLSGMLGLGYVWILIDKQRQGWHDKLAQTIVVVNK
jgi:uncharacterized RDD family membrane protein YckC/uncharacterized membrane protein